LLFEPQKKMKVIKNFTDGIHMELGLYMREKRTQERKIMRATTEKRKAEETEARLGESLRRNGNEN